jgi:cell wall-associated NlpC family hydrolase
MKIFLSLLFAYLIILFTGCATAKTGEAPATIHAGAGYSQFLAAVELPLASYSPLLISRLLITREAATYIRTPYASPPNVPFTFDCSSFISHVYAQFGYILPRTSGAYNNVGRRINWEDALPGDLLVFSRTRGSNVISHVAMLWGKGDTGALAGSWIIHAASINTGMSLQRGNPDSRTGIVITQLGLRADGIKENEYFYQRFLFCVRVLPD